MYRFYRNNMKSEQLISYNLKIEETDLYISSDINLYDQSHACISYLRSQIQDFIKNNFEFKTSLSPIILSDDASEIISRMCRASELTNVGPMASVAGAISQMLCEQVGTQCDNFIIENGGDIYLKTNQDRIISIYAGENNLKDKLKILIRKELSPISICSSSSNFGHSLSFGKADCVTILSKDAFLCDSCATAICNMVRSPEDIPVALEHAMSIDGILGAVVIISGKIGIIGDIELA